VLVGPDERTAALWRDGTWKVLGDGGVTVIREGEPSAFAAGSLIDGLPQPAAAR
jgi:hypothetical protein